MCGVIGYSPVAPSDEVRGAFRRLFDESRVRGTHAYGIAETNGEDVRAFRSFTWIEVVERFHPECPTIAHTRYCQSGDWRDMANNQPLVVGHMALAMNGVLHMGTKEEFERDFGVVCQADNDSEIFLQRLALGQDPVEFINEISGSFAATWLKDGRVYAGRNERRPLYWTYEFGADWWASTLDIFQRAGFTTAPQLLEPGDTE